MRCHPTAWLGSGGDTSETANLAPVEARASNTRCRSGSLSCQKCTLQSNCAMTCARSRRAAKMNGLEWPARASSSLGWIPRRCISVAICHESFCGVVWNGSIGSPLNVVTEEKDSAHANPPIATAPPRILPIRPDNTVNGTRKKMTTADAMYLGSTRTAHRNSCAARATSHAKPSWGRILPDGLVPPQQKAENPSNKKSPALTNQEFCKAEKVLEVRVRKQSRGEPDVKPTVPVGIVVPDGKGYGKNASELIDPR